MAENKKGFVLYADNIDSFTELTDEEAGQLIKHVFKYVNDENPVAPNQAVKLSFISIKRQLKKDLQKYYKTCERNKINGSKGGRPKNPTEPKKPTGLNGNPTEPKKPDTDTDTEKDIINLIKELDLETIFMQLQIEPSLMPKYRNDFIAKIMTADKVESFAKTKTWLVNWLKMQPKRDLNYLTPEEINGKGLNTKRKYIWHKVSDNQNYAGLLSDKEKKDRNLDIEKVYTINNELIN
jgi:hypothetical protein